MINKNGSMGNRFFCFVHSFCLHAFQCKPKYLWRSQKFNENWLFSLSDDSLGASASYDDSKWRKLDLPHDWSVEGQLSPSLASCTGYLPGGIGWYRKHFQVTDKAARHYIYFEEHITAARFI